MRIQQMKQRPRRRQTVTFLPTSICWRPVGSRYEQGLEKPVLSSGTGSFQSAAEFIAQAHGRITDKLAWLNPWLLDVNEWMLSHEIGYPFENSPLDDATDPKLVALNGWFKAHPIHKAWIDQLATGDDVNWAHEVRIKVSQDQWISKQDDEYIAADRIVERRHAKENYWRNLASTWSLGAVALAALAWLLVGLGAIGYFIGRHWGNDLSGAQRSTGFCSAAAITFGVAAVTFAVFGLVPAYRPHLEHYNWYVRGASIAILTLALVLFVAWCVRTILVGRRQDRQARSWAYHLAPAVGAGEFDALHHRAVHCHRREIPAIRHRFCRPVSHELIRRYRRI